MYVANNWMAGQITLPDEVLANVFNLVASIQAAARQGSFCPQPNTNLLSQSVLLESLIDEYAEKL